MEEILFIKNILLIFFIITSNTSFALEPIENGFLSRKISTLQELSINELDALSRRMARVKVCTKMFCGILILAPYTVLYYAEYLPTILSDQIRYGLPPWSILTYSFTTFRSLSKTDELGVSVKREIEPFSLILPALIQLVEHIETEVDHDDPQLFFDQIKNMWQYNEILAKFFHQIMIKVLEKYPHNEEVRVIFTEPIKWELYVILSVVKFFERSDDKFFSLRQSSPTIYLPFMETGSMTFHGYTNFLDALANEVKDSVSFSAPAYKKEQNRDDGTKLIVKKLISKLK